MTNNDDLALKPGTYAILFRDNWDGEGDVYKTLATLGDDLVWYHHESGTSLIEYEGDEVLKVWPLDDGSNALSLLAERDADKKRIAELESENEYVRKRFKEVDLLFGKNLLVMKAAIIEWQSTGEAKTGLSWIFNTLLGPGELPSEEERDAQAYFDREYAPMDEELMALHKWFWERNDRIKSERAAAGIKLEVRE